MTIMCSINYASTHAYAWFNYLWISGYRSIALKYVIGEVFDLILLHCMHNLLYY
jgi:hypothetical protein